MKHFIASPAQLRAPSLPKRLLVSVLVAVSGSGCLWFGSVHTARAQSARTDQASVEMITIRNDLARAQLAELGAMMLEPFGLASSDDVAETERLRVDTVAQSRVELRALSFRDDVDQDEIAEVLIAIDDWVPEFVDARPFDLYNGSGAIRAAGVPLPRDPPTVVDSLHDLAVLDIPSEMTMLESIITAFGQEPAASDQLTREFFGLAEAYIAGAPGLFGPLEADPLAQSSVALWIAQAHEAPTVDEVSTVLRSTDLWDVDRRNNDPVERTATDRTAELADHVTQARTATLAIRDLIDTRLEVRHAEFGEGADSAAGTARLARTIAVALLAVAAAGAIGALAAAWSRARELRRQINLDPLTGAGNRNLLHTKSAMLLAEPSLDHHAVVMIDLDRFKLVNDTYGHAAGDALLRRLAAGLGDTAAAMDVVDATVVRLGGDEFTLTLHDTEPIDVDALRQHLDALRSVSIAIDDLSPISVDFSYGVASADGAPELDRLLRAADLAAYEEKAARRRAAVAGARQDGISV